MNRRNIIILVAAITVVIGLGVLTSLIGNVGVRRVNTQNNIVLTLSDPVIPGINTTVRWTPPDFGETVTVTFAIQEESNGTQNLSTAKLSDGSVSVEVPCEAGGQVVGLTMKNTETNELISWREVNVLAAGPDCLR